jgi:hypothetical protein
LKSDIPLTTSKENNQKEMLCNEKVFSLRWENINYVISLPNSIETDYRYLLEIEVFDSLYLEGKSDE